MAHNKRSQAKPQKQNGNSDPVAIILNVGCKNINKKEEALLDVLKKPEHVDTRSTIGQKIKQTYSEKHSLYQLYLQNS